MRFVIFDTAQEWAIVMMAWDEHIAWRKLKGYARHSEHVLAAFEELQLELGLQGSDLRMLDAIAFAAGPGAFTGVRLAASFAHGLALALDKPVLALDSLKLALLSAALPQAKLRRAWVVADARMQQWYAAFYESFENSWQCLHGPVVEAPSEILAQASTAADALIGYGISMEELHARIEAACFKNAALTLAAVDAFEPAALIAEAHAAWQRGAALAPEEAQPIYVRHEVAHVPAKTA